MEEFTRSNEFNQEQFDYNYDDYSGRRHSRSRSRDRSRKRRHHSSGKHRHHHKRSSSYTRSRSRERKQPRVHINPIFGALGPSATSLLETNNRLEAEVARLQNEVTLAHARITVLENELGTVAMVRSRIEQQLNAVHNEKRRVQDALNDTRKNVSLLERSLSTLKNELSASNKEREKINGQLKISELEVAGHTEQVAFLTKRNEVLGKKCEELVEKNRMAREERDEALQSATSMTREVENMQANVDLRLVEYKRMENELGTAREKERMWKTEKMEIEKRLSSKDSLLVHERKQAELQKKRDREQIDRLEDKLKSERPGWEGQLGIESIFRALDVVKEEFGQQINQLKDQVDPLIDENRRSTVIPIAISHVAHPPRVHSAPPAPISHSFDPCPSHYSIIRPPDMKKTTLQENQPDRNIEKNFNSVIQDTPVACPPKDIVAPFTEIVLNAVPTNLISTVSKEVMSDVIETQGNHFIVEKNEIPEQECINLDDESLLEGVPLDVSHPIDEAALLDGL